MRVLDAIARPRLGLVFSHSFSFLALIPDFYTPNLSVYWDRWPWALLSGTVICNSPTRPFRETHHKMVIAKHQKCQKNANRLMIPHVPQDCCFRFDTLSSTSSFKILSLSASSTLGNFPMCGRTQSHLVHRSYLITQSFALISNRGISNV